MFNDILVPLDGSELSERALPMAQGLAKSSEATVHLIQMVSREHEFAAGRGIDSDQASEYEMDLARRLTESQLNRGRTYLEQIGSQLSGAGIKTETEFTVKAGNPAQNIIDYVQEHSINLVVMTTHGHGGIRRMLVGSVTERVVHSCEVPVLVVPCS